MTAADYGHTDDYRAPLQDQISRAGVTTEPFWVPAFGTCGRTTVDHTQAVRVVAARTRLAPSALRTMLDRGPRGTLYPAESQHGQR